MRPLSSKCQTCASSVSRTVLPVRRTTSSMSMSASTMRSDSTTALSANQPEKALRTAILAVELGRQHGIAEAELRDAFYVNLLRYLGCVGFAHEEAHVYGAGDDIGTRYVMGMSDAGDAFGTVRRIVG